MDDYLICYFCIFNKRVKERVSERAREYQSKRVRERENKRAREREQGQMRMIELTCGSFKSKIIRFNS